MTLEQLLRTQVKVTNSETKKEVEFSPDFRVAVQNLDAEVDGKKGVHVIIHAQDHDSDTLDLFVSGNKTWKFY